jgi:cytoskeletal protein RodZ
MEPTEEKKPEVASVAETPAAETAATPEVKPAPTKKSFWSKILPWVIVAVIFFLGGVATIYFALYQPAVNTAKADAAAAEQQIAELSDKVGQAEIDTAAIQTELDTAKTDLTAAQTTIAEQTTELAKSNQVKVAYKFLLDVNAARAALEKLDTNTALQAINFAKVDLADLQATNIDAAATTGFADRLDEAANNITEPDLLKSRDALDTLYSSLLLLVNNLK